MAWWESHNYQSFCLPSEESEAEDPEDPEAESAAQRDPLEDAGSTSITYVSGDVTHPQAGAEDAIVVHCVGEKWWRWGGGTPRFPCQEPGRLRQNPDLRGWMGSVWCGQNRNVHFRAGRRGCDSVPG